MLLTIILFISLTPIAFAQTSDQSVDETIKNRFIKAILVFVLAIGIAAGVILKKTKLKDKSWM